MPKKTVKVLGLGLNGIITAISLASEKINVKIIEKFKTSSNNQLHDNRNISLTLKSKNFFEKIGIWDELKNHCSEVKDIYVVDNKNPQFLHFENDKNTESVLGYMIPYSSLFKVALDIANKNEFIEIIYSDYEVETKENKYKITLNNKDSDKVLAEENSSDNIIINCEGSRSKLRKLFQNFDFIKDYKQTALIFNIKHEKPHEGTAIEHFTPTGIFAFLPLKGECESSIVWSLKNDFCDLYLDMPKDKFTYFVKDLLGEQFGEIEIITEIQKHSIMGQITSNYYNKNIVLVGDIAHSIHPLAGQGFNQGVNDIEEISEIIKNAYSCNLSVSESDLREYQKKRKADNIMMFLSVDLLNKVFVNDFPVLNKIRKYGLQILNKFEFFKNKLIND